MKIKIQVNLLLFCYYFCFWLHQTNGKYTIDFPLIKTLYHFIHISLQKANKKTVTRITAIAIIIKIVLWKLIKHGIMHAQYLTQYHDTLNTHFNILSLNAYGMLIACTAILNNNQNKEGVLVNATIMFLIISLYLLKNHKTESENSKYYFSMKHIVFVYSLLFCKIYQEPLIANRTSILNFIPTPIIWFLLWKFLKKVNYFFIQQNLFYKLTTKLLKIFILYSVVSLLTTLYKINQDIIFIWLLLSIYSVLEYIVYVPETQELLRYGKNEELRNSVMNLCQTIIIDNIPLTKIKKLLNKDSHNKNHKSCYAESFKQFHKNNKENIIAGAAISFISIKKHIQCGDTNHLYPCKKINHRFDSIIENGCSGFYFYFIEELSAEVKNKILNLENEEEGRSKLLTLDDALITIKKIIDPNLEKKTNKEVLQLVIMDINKALPDSLKLPKKSFSKKHLLPILDSI